MKKVIICLLIIVILLSVVFIFRKKVFDKYKIIDNDTVSYKYVDNYSEYLSFTESTVKVSSCIVSDISLFLLLFV